VKTYLATKNAGKLAELRAMFHGSVLDLHTYEGYMDVAEDATSYLGNALLKARALEAQLREAGIAAAVLADDSGLEVDVLGGRPGVLSARYAGRDTSWPQRRATLLRELKGVPEEQRTAHFVCLTILIPPQGEPVAGIGLVDGRIVEERGDGGFGYDPLFYYPPLGKTFGEITEQEKNAVSHRRRSAESLLAALRTRV
jgi:XTP/dITP diphosphohydrolase